jgi:hypothetical protein
VSRGVGPAGEESWPAAVAARRSRRQPAFGQIRPSEARWRAVDRDKTGQRLASPGRSGLAGGHGGARQDPRLGVTVGVRLDDAAMDRFIRQVVGTCSTCLQTVLATNSEASGARSMNG